MHKIIWTIIVGICIAAPASAQTLKIATLAPEGSFWMVEMRAGAEKIDERTAGRVQFRFYGGGVQGNDSQVRRKMRIGQLHGATFTSGALGAFAPDAELYALPMTFRDMDEVLHVRKRMDGRLRQALEQAGMVNFGIAGAGQGYLMSHQPVASLKDMEGQRTWVQEGDRIAYAAFQALGISPVTMPLTDVLTGLQTELLDSAALSPVGAVVLQLHTKLRYITNLPLSYVYGALVIDERAFGKLSTDDQAVVREVMEGIYRKIDQASIRDNEQALEALVSKGLKLVDPARDQVPLWQARVS
ncbi:MAG: TRAP transporter substrate-binding protein DctP, partial [Xanthomonadales bacterium]|nr:TRAP transporter substrate-binding protein DctP [Xanthomonadales bacterium]